MPPTAKPPAPPSFYSNMASMSGGQPGADKPGGDKKPGGGGGEDEIEIVKTLFRVFEKWRKAVGGDKEKTDLIQQMADTLQKYNDKFTKSDGGGGATKEPPPSSSEGQGPAPGAGGAGGAEGTQPVPA